MPRQAAAATIAEENAHVSSESSRLSQAQRMLAKEFTIRLSHQSHRQRCRLTETANSAQRLAVKLM
jgi:hypothetical protein